MLAWVLDRESTFFSMDKYVGVFGFFDRSQALIAFIPFGLFGGFFGGTGYVVATKFFPPVVTATALLVELPICQLIGYYLGIDKFPGLQTIIGAIFAVVGLLCMQHAQKQRAAQ